MKLMVLPLFLMLLISCSKYATTGEYRYQKSHNGTMIQVPAPLNDKNISHLYDLPQANKDLPTVNKNDRVNEI